MQRTINQTRRVLAVLMLAVLTAVCLTACASGAATTEDRKPWRPPVSRESKDPAVVPALAEPIETVSDPEPAQTPEPNDLPADDAEPEQPAVESADANLDPASVQGVARLGDLVGNYAMDQFYDFRGQYVFVDTEGNHNPYDLTWRYGPSVNTQKEMNAENWDELYKSYINACDWSLVFDAEYYKKAFPMLAKLYHENDELLLEHFQTQGVHEGRQANASFNVAAYMNNCNDDLVTAFGENYECYYFYYMLNQNTQKSVDARNPDNAYSRWMTVELSLQQTDEYKQVTRHRDQASTHAVTLDPEMLAMANYRAWYDAEHNLYGHDWIHDAATKSDVNDCLNRVSNNSITENTVKWYSTSGQKGYKSFATYYANSEDHYTAMVSDEYFYFGCSNPYWSDNPDNPFAKNGNTAYVCQFDLFTAVQPRTPYELD